MKGGIYFDEKLERRRKRMLKIKIYAGLAAFFVLLIGAGYLIIYSSFFRITRININNTQIDADKTVENLESFFVGQSKIAEFLGPENILIWKPEKISEFIKNYPQIAELKIEKNYFGREIKISVLERERFGIWCFYSQINADDKQIDADNISENLRSNLRESAFCGWFDKKGVIFSEALMAEGQLINKVDDFSSRSFPPEADQPLAVNLGEPALEEKFLSNLFKIFEILEKSDLKIKSLRLENLEFQEVVTDSPLMPKIHFSLRINPEFALAALESIKKIGFEKIEYIDLRVENRAYYKMK